MYAAVLYITAQPAYRLYLNSEIRYSKDTSLALFARVYGKLRKKLSRNLQ